MNSNSIVDIERLAEQLLSNQKYKQNDEQKEKISKRLHEQLVEKEAVVKLQRMDDECLNLIDTLQQKLLFLQDVLSPPKKYDRKSELNAGKSSNKENIKSVPKEYKVDDLFELNLSSDSSDDEALSIKISKNKAENVKQISANENAKEEVKEIEAVIEIEREKPPEHESVLQQDDSEPIFSKFEDDIPLALRRKPRDRKASYRSLSSSSSSSRNVASKNHRYRSHGKKETTVSTSGVAYHDDEDVIVEEDCDKPHTFHIKIPSLFKGQVHELRLDSLEFGRKVFDYRARQAKQKCLQMKQQQQLDCFTNPKKKKSQKSNDKLSASRHHQEFLQQQDAQFSQLIEDVMNETGNEETLLATTALENINNDINDNYESFAPSLLPLSQSSHELSLSQNSKLCSNKKEESTKKPRKTTKRSNDHKPNEPAKKRGRKPKHKNTTEHDSLTQQSQPPTKSNLAKYVEYFGNDCELLPPGSQTPAASSTMSQPLVSSTTQNFELIEQNQQQQQSNQQMQQQQPITYYIDGDWANGGPCQLVQTTGMTIDAGQISQDVMSAPFQDFVNYIDNNTDTGNNVIARVLDNCNSLPISIPLPISNMGYQNIFQTRQSQQQTTQNIMNQPVINIQIPSLPSITNNTGTPPPPMAHSHEEGILDLSIKSNAATINTYDNLNIKTKQILDLSSTAIEDDNCLPLDLSTKNATIYQSYNNREESVVEHQDDDFIRRLIETSDFDLRPQELTKGGNNSNTTTTTTTTTTTYDDGKSFKAALNMPLLEFDDQVLEQFVENGTTKMSDVNENDKLNDNVIINDSTNCISNNDSNYVSMNESNSNILHSPFGNEIHFADQTTKEIFDKLLDIHPPKDDCNIMDYVGDKEATFSFAELDESSFVNNNNVQNSTMYERENPIPINQSNSNEDQPKCSVIQQIILESTDHEKSNNNKPKFLPRILKRRNSLFKKIPMQEKPNDDNAKIVENLNENLNKTATPQTETNLNKTIMETADTPTNDDKAKIISDHIIVQNECSMEVVKINEKGKDTKQLTILIEDLNCAEEHLVNENETKLKKEDFIVKESSNISEKERVNYSMNEHIKETLEEKEDTPINDDKAKIISELLIVENASSMEVVNINEKVKDTKQSTPLIEDLNSAKEHSINESETKPKNEDFIVKESSNISNKETLKYSMNEHIKETLEDVKETSNILENSSEELTTSTADRIENIESLKTASNENSINLINESSTDILNGDEAVEMDNTKQSTSIDDNKQSCIENENLNKEQLSDSLINLKTTEIDISDSLEHSLSPNTTRNINSPKTSTKPDKSLDLKLSESDSSAKSNNPNKSIQINIPEKSTDDNDDVSLNLENDSLDKTPAEINCPEKEIERDALEKSNQPIQINLPEKSKESEVSLNLEISESDSLEKSNQSDRSLNLEMSESNSLEKSNSSNKTDPPLNLEMCEIDTLEKSNQPIQINLPEKSKESEVSLNLEISESDSLEKSNQSDQPLNLEMSESDSLEKSNGSNKSSPIKSPYKGNESDKSVNLEIPKTDNSKHDGNKLNEKMEMDDSKMEAETNDTIRRKSYDDIPSLQDIELKSNQSDQPLNLEMSESDSLEKSNGSNKSIPINSPYKGNESDKSVNLEIPKTDNSKHDGNKLYEKMEMDDSKMEDETNDTIRRKSYDGLPSNNDIELKMDDSKMEAQTNDTISRKSYNDQSSHHNIELKMDDSKMEAETNDLEYTQPQSVEEKNDCMDHANFNNMSQMNIESFNIVPESHDIPLCLTTEIQKKYYAESWISDVIDLSVKNDTDIEDNLVMDFDDTQSPKVVNNLIHELIKEKCNSAKTKDMENPTPIIETQQETDNNNAEEEGSKNNEKMDEDLIDVAVENISEENKPKTSNFGCLKAHPDVSHLTPLELDSKLEDTLDFEEDFDDALSLATSCFDSPNDDRFEDSILDESEPPTSVAQITNNDNNNSCIDNEVPKQTTKISALKTPPKSQPSSMNGLKNFKIPKLTKTFTTPIDLDSQINCKGNLTSSSLKSNIPANIQMKQAIVKLEHITRTVKNELAATGSINVNQLQKHQLLQQQPPPKPATSGSVNVNQLQKHQLLQQQPPPKPPATLTQPIAKQHIKINFTDKPEPVPPSSEMEPKNWRTLPLQSDNITKLFGITCQPYLVNKCYAITHCPLSHQLNDPDSVMLALGSLSPFDLNDAYRYVYNHSNMFKVYFIVFCNLFTLRNDRTKLLNMINDVERYPEFAQFVIVIYEAIVKCGLSRVNACRQILKRSRERLTGNIDALVAIIMQSDWTMFTDYIEQYTEEIYKYNFSISVLEQMTPAVLNSKGPQLKQVFGKCVQTLRGEDTGLLLNSPSLIQCVALLTSTT